MVTMDGGEAGCGGRQVGREVGGGTVAVSACRPFAGLQRVRLPSRLFEGFLKSNHGFARFMLCGSIVLSPHCGSDFGPSGGPHFVSHIWVQSVSWP